jgi:hypothetical protein
MAHNSHSRERLLGACEQQTVKHCEPNAVLDELLDQLSRLRISAVCSPRIDRKVVA